MSEKINEMRCPVDGAVLVMSERSGIEIDYCPTCRGVWLDRGELDKIIERTNLESGRSARPEPTTERWGEGARGSDHGYGQRKRKKSFLEGLFD